MGTRNKQTAKYMDPWHDREPTSVQKGAVKDALVNFILHKDMKNKWPKPSNELCKSLLPFLGPLNKSWFKVTSDNFEPNNHTAHRRMYDIVRNMLTNQGELKKLIEAAEEEMDEQTEQEVRKMTTTNEYQDDQFKRPDDIDKFTVEGARNLELPESDEDTPQKNEQNKQPKMLKKRHGKGGDIKDEPDQKKIRGVCEIQELYDDFVAKRAGAKEAEELWRTVRDSMKCLRTPTSSQYKDEDEVDERD